MTAVLKHELRNYFHSFTAYVFGAFLLAIVGVGAMLYNLEAAVSNFEYVLSFGTIVFVVIVPILTMRVIAEERRQKTDQLLYSLPITTTQVILGKYLALLVIYLIPLALICVYPLIFAQYGDVYLPTSYGSLAAIFLMGAALVAVGVFISSLTDNQGLAAGIGIAVILFNYYSVSLSEYVSSTSFGSVVALAVLVLALGAVVRCVTGSEALGYGLDDPICTIDLDTGEEHYEITLGSYSTMDSQRYVSLGDGNVYLVTNDPLDYYDADLSDLIKHDEIPALDTVTYMSFEGADTYQVVYEEYTEDSPYTYCEEDVYFKQSGKDLLPLDTSLVERYLDALSGLVLSDYVTYHATEEELAQYGLQDPELTVTVGYTPADTQASEGDSQTFTIRISRDPAQRGEEERAQTDSDTAQEEDITAYARIGDSAILYQISGDSYTALMKAGYNDLRHHEVLATDFSHVTGMDISLEGEVYVITSTGSGDDRRFSYEGEEVSIDDLQSALESVSAESFTGESPTQKEEIGLTVYLDNEVHPKVQIELYRYSGEQCLALIDGEPICLVPRSSVVALVEAIHAIVL